MQYLVQFGSLLTLIGVACLIWCIRVVFLARRNATDDADLRARLQRVVALNLAALGISAIGLMLVVAGIVLG